MASSSLADQNSVAIINAIIEMIAIGIKVCKVPKFVLNQPTNGYVINQQAWEKENCVANKAVLFSLN